jgi:hypothetical protein
MSGGFGQGRALRCVLIGAGALLATACTTNPTRDERIRGETQPYIGQPLTAFMQATGEAPYDKYDTSDGRRHFLFERSRFMQIPGYGGGTLTCKRTVETEPDGRGGTPDAFRIVSITSTGAC